MGDVTIDQLPFGGVASGDGSAFVIAPLSKPPAAVSPRRMGAAPATPLDGLACRLNRAKPTPAKQTQTPIPVRRAKKPFFEAGLDFIIFSVDVSFWVRTS